MSSSTPSLTVDLPAWASLEDVVEVVPSITSDSAQFDALPDYVLAASNLLFQLSGRQFPGKQQRKVRPCRSGCGCWGEPSTGFTYWSWTYSSLGGWSWRNEGGDQCGCGTESYITLAGPVVSVDEVKVDGVVLSPINYRLDRKRYLIYMEDVTVDPPMPRQWPSCQSLDLDDDQPGTFSVTYTWGVDPPILGVKAAAQLAGELWRAGPGGGDSKLPSRVTKVVRQGVSLDKIVPIADLLAKGNTGLVLVDAFIAGYNRTKMSRKPAVWSPDVRKQGRKVGQ